MDKDTWQHISIPLGQVLREAQAKAYELQQQRGAGKVREYEYKKHLSDEARVDGALPL